MLLLAFLSLSARAADEVISRYELVSKGITIGSAETTRSRMEYNGEPATRLDVSTKVDVDLLLVNCHLDSKETAVIGPDGVMAFHLKTVKDGTCVELSGGLTNGVMSVVRISKGATNYFEIARTNYSFCTLDGFETQIEKGGPALTKRVFDCARGETFERTFRCVAEEEISVCGKNVPCRVVEFSDDQKKGKRWVYSDELGMVIVRQDAKEPAGSYSLRLKEYLVRPIAASAKSASTQSAE